MLIYYCDGCSLKIPQEQIENGQSYKTATGMYCSQCVANGVVKRPAQSTHAIRPAAVAKTPTRIIPKAARPPEKKNSPFGAVLGAVGIVLVLLAFSFLPMFNRHETKLVAVPTEPKPAPPQTSQALPSSSATPLPNPAPNTSPTPSPLTKPAEPAASIVDPEWIAYAANALEGARKKYKENPDDVRGYLQKLKNINSGYGNTPAGKEAARLLDESKLLENVLANQDLVIRDGVGIKERQEAISAIAKAKGSSAFDELAWAVRSSKGQALCDLAQIMVQWDRAALAKSREQVLELALKHPEKTVRRAGFAALIRADGSAEQAWALASKSPLEILDLLDATALLTQPEDAKLMDGLAEKIQMLLKELPASSLVTTATARYVRIELPGPQRPLTLAEVQVFCGAKNVALGGTATQSSTLDHGEAAHAIDGNTNGNFFAYTSSHTIGNETNPWWEVDLGAEYKIDKVVIWNRTEGEELARRLDNFTLLALDANRIQAFKKENNPAPPLNCTIEMASDQASLRKAATEALERCSKNRPH